MSVIETIKAQINDNTILLYMKGEPAQPQCGFSAQAIQALQACGHPFGFVNILENPDIRQALPEYAKWPTFPQLWVKGELIGGCDIIVELFQEGQLQTILDEAMA